jgi:2-oxoglutarate dehydrogenase complex dehydrogenase (E1) component-like enzyme
VRSSDRRRRPAARGRSTPGRQTLQATHTWPAGAAQVNGHFAAQLDPLGLDKRPLHTELDPATYGFSEADMDRE